MTSGDQADIRSARQRSTDSTLRYIVAPQRYAEAHQVDGEVRFVATGTRWIQSDTTVEVRA